MVPLMVLSMVLPMTLEMTSLLTNSPLIPLLLVLSSLLVLLTVLLHHPPTTAQAFSPPSPSTFGVLHLQVTAQAKTVLTAFPQLEMLALPPSQALPKATTPAPTAPHQLTVHGTLRLTVINKQATSCRSLLQVQAQARVPLRLPTVTMMVPGSKAALFPSALWPMPTLAKVLLGRLL